jgi:hypothetical protein
MLGSIGCSSSEIEDLIDSSDGFDRKPIDRSVLGINAFVNDLRFGSIRGQFEEVRNVLGIRRARVLMAWNDQIQPTPGATPNFSFYDDIISSAPADMELLVILTDVPTWMSDRSNWVGDNPRRTFVERWVRPVLSRYSSSTKIVGWQIWNEPNNRSFRENDVIQVTDSPENYVELLALASNVVESLTPTKLLLNGATTAINQNFPDTLNYNRAMRDAGAREFVDRWAVHYYGKQFENLVREGGVRDFLNGLGEQIWLTESGEQGVNNQLAYGEEVWPNLQERIPAIERIFIYQFTDSSSVDSTYGLRTLSPQFPVSDLYISLRDGAR